MAKVEDIDEIEDVLLREVSTILSVDESEISASTPLASVGMDSIRFVELLLFIERKFGIELIKQNLTADDVKDVASLARSIHAANQG